MVSLGQSLPSLTPIAGHPQFQVRPRPRRPCSWGPVIGGRQVGSMVTQGEKALAPHLHTDGLICIQTGLICIGSVGHIPKFPTPVLASRLPSQRPLPSPSAPSGLDLSVSKRGPTLRHTAPPARLSWTQGSCPPPHCHSSPLLFQGTSLLPSPAGWPPTLIQRVNGP